MLRCRAHESRFATLPGVHRVHEVVVDGDASVDGVAALLRRLDAIAADADKVQVFPTRAEAEAWLTL